ncbi:NAD(P)-dependent dehydrogenase (short-subunit alcohol dehydrogenase family) [Novosphingobium taihuense]|uniref:NAD(P)-dependent dehydrogenase (Short-subunit alcohol dehydrogenase family) n=1 Tax=Novosphingobium taihuense TaxID=260085 RepID=A0A7W7AC57_9SPHN|nr:NAD(P)-dependent dehydrogenase (short-subunit alcohol dehydrogenase family) [Novosphingobium taihuense]
MSFENRVAVVTGAGSGLGRGYALELARRGAKVVVNDLGGSPSGEGASASAAQIVVDTIRSAGGEAVASMDSVATREGGAAIIQTALDTWGKVDVLISNAGFLRNNRFEDLSDNEIDPIVDVHLKGAFYVGQPAYRAMRAQGYGRILFTGSSSGMFGHAWQANYAASKAGMVGLSNAVAIEGSAYGIQSNVLLPNALSRLEEVMTPGYMEIPAFAEALQATDFSFADGRMPPEFTVPLAIYLVSEACSATQGIYSSNSGRYARVRVCEAEGWVAPAGTTPPSAEDIASHFEDISELREFSLPRHNYDEFTIGAQVARKQGVHS